MVRMNQVQIDSVGMPWILSHRMLEARLSIERVGVDCYTELFCLESIGVESLNLWLHGVICKAEIAVHKTCKNFILIPPLFIGKLAVSSTLEYRVCSMPEFWQTKH